LDEKELEGGRFFMKHYTFDEWLEYVNDEISENTKQELEDHLYDCDQCLNQYLMAMELNESSLPILSDMSSFTDAVMAEVSKQPTVVPDTISNLDIMPTVPSVPDTKVDTKMKRKPYYQQAVFHYLLAAAATLLLTFSGVFQSLATYANSIEKPAIQEKRPSVTEGVINKTFAWMDSLEKKEAVKK
jgi:type IV secretory pathway VirJ component